MIGASFAARSSRGGSALARPFDGSNLDITTGPAASLAALSNSYTGTALSAGTGAPNNAGNLGSGVSRKSIAYSGGNPVALELYQGARVVDTYCELPISGQDSGPVSVIRSRVPTAVNAQVAFNNSQPAISVSGLIKDCVVDLTAEDGIWLKSDTVIEGLSAMGGSVPFFGGFPVDPSVIPWHTGDTVGNNTGQPMTKAQILSAINYYNANGSGVNGGTNGVTVPWGAFIIVPSNGGSVSPMYQCIGSVDGTTNPPLIGNENVNTWPVGSTNKWCLMTGAANSTPAQPFTSGNALFAYVGNAYHCDTFQCVGQISRVVIRNFRAGQFADSICLLQNDATVKSLPPMNWLFEHGVCYGAGTVDIPLSTLTGVNSANGDHSWSPPSGSNASLQNPQGPFQRNSDGTWQVSPSSGMSLPWFVTMRDLKHMNSTSSFIPARNPSAVVTFDKAYNTVGVPILRSVAQRKLLLANQYGWDSGDQRVAMMEAGTYPWATAGQPQPVSSVLEARLNAIQAAVPLSSAKAQVLGGVPCSVAAQCMQVVEITCRNQQGIPLTPSTNAGINYPVNTAVTDADGYLVGVS